MVRDHHSAVLRHGDFRSVDELIAALEQFIARWNRREAHPVPLDVPRPALGKLSYAPADTGRSDQAGEAFCRLTRLPPGCTFEYMAII